MGEEKKINEEAITLAETKSILDKVKERDEEFGFRAGRTYEYLNVIEIQNEKKAQEMKQKIAELDIPRLKTEHIVKIVDLMPRSLEELKVVLQGVTITNENLKKIEGLLGNAS